jgi:plasmid stability protein
MLPGLVLAAYVGLGGLALAQNVEPVWPKLTPKLQDLLQKEMLSVHEASREILTATIEGNDERVAELAQQIHDSFILRQSMTPEDKADLMAVAPDGFVKLDREFHEISAELAQAARDKDRARQHETYGHMIGACSACHAQYATDRFPNFAE